jgi:hypothetical protein
VYTHVSCGGIHEGGFSPIPTGDGFNFFSADGWKHLVMDAWPYFFFFFFFLYKRARVAGSDYSPGVFRF